MKNEVVVGLLLFSLIFGFTLISAGEINQFFEGGLQLDSKQLNFSVEENVQYFSISLPRNANISAAYFNLSGLAIANNYPKNISIKISDFPNSQWYFPNEFNFSVSPNQTLNLLDYINAALSDGWCNCSECGISYGRCNVPFRVSILQGSSGILQISNLSIIYSTINYPIVIRSFSPVNDTLSIHRFEDVYFRVNYVDRNNEAVKWNWTYDGELVLPAWGDDYHFNMSSEFQGEHNLTWTIGGGNNSLSKTWKIIANQSYFLGNITNDTTPPQINLIYPENITYDYTTYPTGINYTVSDETLLDSCRYSVDNGITNITVVCGENITGLNPIEGDNLWLVDSNDTSGNRASSYTLFNYNATVPPINNTSGSLILISPVARIYNYQSILFNITSTINLTKLVYSDNGNRESILCTNCYDYAKFKTLTEGNHTLFFRGSTVTENNITNQVNLFVDSKSPVISTIKPQSNRYTNGSNFYIRYTEDNLQDLILFYGSEQVSMSDCESGKNKNCILNVDLGDYNNQNTVYRFKLIDIAGNIKESRNTTVKVDTISPKITFFNYSISVGYVTFNMSIDELNFYKISYNDNNGRDRTLCSSLKNGYCTKKLYFSRGNHTISIKVLDDAGNSVQERVYFTI